MMEHKPPANWAPACLIGEYEYLNERIRRDGVASMESRPTLPTADLAGALHRLLTREDMRSAWATLGKDALPKRISQRSSLMGMAVPDMYWAEIKFAMGDFAGAPKHTAKEKRESLLRIATQARALIKSIGADPYAADIEKRTPRNRAATLHLSLRTGDHDDWPSGGSGEFLSGDASEARGLSRESMSPWKELDDNNLFDVCDEALSLSDEEWEARSLTMEDIPGYRKTKWEQLPTEQRFAFWTRALYTSSLTDLLGHFAGWVEQESRNAPEIKQPGRGDQAMVPFLTRRLSDLALELHGTPLDETIGIIVTAALDLPAPLTREDVRDYRRPGGAKLAVVS